MPASGSSLQVVLWDVDGTLVDYAMSMGEFLEKKLASFDLALDLLPDEDVLAAEDLRLAEQDSWRTVEDERRGFFRVTSVLLRSVAPSREKLEQVADSFSRYFDLYRPVPGVRQILADLQRVGVRQGVVSNWPPSLRAFLDHHDLTRFFEVIVCSGEVGVVKPDRRIFELAFAALGVEGPECVYIGDNPANDIGPARALGMAAIHFNPRGDYDPADERTASGLRRKLFGMLGIDGAPATP